MVRVGLAVAAVASAAVGVGAEVEVLAELAVVVVDQEDHAQAFCAEMILWASQQLSSLCTSIGPCSSLGAMPTHHQAPRL